MLGTRNRRKSGAESLPDSDSHDGTAAKRNMPDKENGKGQKKKKVTTPAQLKRKTKLKQPTKAKQLDKSSNQANPEPDSLELDSPGADSSEFDSPRRSAINILKPAQLADMMNADLSSSNSDTSTSFDESEEDLQ